MGHLTADERRRLETLLNRGESFRSIAEILGKSHSTISREIRKHRTVSSKAVSPYILNNCTYRSRKKFLDLQNAPLRATLLEQHQRVTITGLSTEVGNPR